MELVGLEVALDKVVYRYDPDNSQFGRPHVFIYFITIRNNSPETISLRGRRWVLQSRGERTQVVEGDGIVGEKPRLRPGESYSFHGFHMLKESAVATGSFHGVDCAGHHIMVRIPSFAMQTPAMRK